MQIIVTPVCTKYIPYPHSTPALLAVTLGSQSFRNHHLSLMDAIQNKIQTFI